MLIAVKYGAQVHGETVDLLVGHHLDGTVLAPDAYPGAVVTSWYGDLSTLDRIGPEPDDSANDSRPYKAPPVDLGAYVKAKRYDVEVAGVHATVGGQTVLVSTARGDDRTNLLATYSSLKAELRTDGATYVFGDGTPRSVSNADMEAICLKALAHIQGAFEVEASLAARIAAGTVKTMGDVDAAFALVPS